MATITILPAQKSAEVPDGELLVEAGELAGVEMEAGCFNCSCGTCAAEVVSGMENLSPPPTKSWMCWTSGTKTPSDSV